MIVANLNILRTLVAVTAMTTPAFAQGVPREGPTWRVRTPPIPGSPPLEVSPPQVHFGDMSPGETRAETIRLVNTGDKPVTIDRVESTCRCAAGVIGETTLAPGESTALSISLDATPHLESMTRRVDIRVKGYAQATVVDLFAEVHRGIRPGFEFAPEHEGWMGVLRLESADGSAFRVLGTSAGAPAFADGFDPVADAPRGAYTLFYEVDPDAPPRWFVVATDHAQSPIVDVPVPSWTAERRPARWGLDPAHAVVGRLNPGQRAEVTLTMQGVDADPLELIEDLRTRPDSKLGVRLLGMSAGPNGMRLRLGVSAREGASGLAVEEVVIRALEDEHRFTLMAVVGGE